MSDISYELLRTIHLHQNYLVGLNDFGLGNQKENYPENNFKDFSTCRYHGNKLIIFHWLFIMFLFTRTA